MSIFKQRQPTANELRFFAGLLTMLTGGLLITFWNAGSALNLVLGVLLTIGAMSLLGIFVPSVIQPLHRILMLLVLPIGWVVSHCMLALVYYLVVTPIGIWRRIRNGDPLQRLADRDVKTYWQDRKEKRAGESYFRQF